jgi:hypothetical protein
MLGNCHLKIRSLDVNAFNYAATWVLHGAVSTVSSLHRAS